MERESDLGRGVRKEEEEEEERMDIGGLFVLTHTRHSCTWMVKWKEGGEREAERRGRERIWRTTTVALPSLPTQQAPPTDADAADGIRLREEGRKVEEREREGEGEGDAGRRRRSNP